MNDFTIKDLENLSGIKAHTIRIWELRYSFLKPRRSNTNIRYYDSEELKKLLNVALLNRYGYRISDISKMDPNTIRERIVSLNSGEANLELMLNELLHGMIDLEMRSFEDIIDKHIASHGIDATIRRLIFPFLERIGILWLTDHVRVSQEHLVSNIIRQKLIAGINSCNIPVQSSEMVMIFLPEGEYHELGVLYVYYLLRCQGIKVLYLGADLPLAEVEYVVKLKQPAVLFTHLTALPHRFSLENYLQQLTRKLPNQKVLVSGRVTRDYSKKLPANIHFKYSIDAVMSEMTLLK